MTPQEKAEELFNNFFDLYPNQDAHWIAKKGALKCVEEILNDENHFMQTHLQYEYWDEVKQEIEKL